MLKRLSHHLNCLTESRSQKLPPLSVVAVLVLACAVPSESQIFKATPVVYQSGGTYAEAVAVADINKDGRADVIVVNSGSYPAGSVGVLLGNGDGTLQSAATYAVHWGADAVAVGDLNGDGWPDMVVGINDGEGVTSLYVLLNKGDGTFEPGVGYNAGFDISSIVIADVNGDGKPDVIALDEIDSSDLHSEIQVLPGNGDGTLGTPAAYEILTENTNSISLAAADLNGDGKPDLVVTGEFMNGSAVYPVIYVLLNKGDGTFPSQVPYPSGGLGSSLILADVNRDGKLDAVLTTTDDQVAVLLGNGNGTFGAPVSYPASLYGYSLTVGDFNGDGAPDLAVSGPQPGNPFNGRLAVLLNNGHGAFQTAVLYSTGGRFSYSVATAKLNQDGKPDLVVADSCDGYVDTCPLGGGVAAFLGVPANTTTKVTTSGTPSLSGQAVTFTATITAAEGPIPNGTVITFYNNGTKLGTAKTTNGIAKFTISSLSVGTHTIKASFPSSAYVKASSGTVSQVVN